MDFTVHYESDGTLLVRADPGADPAVVALALSAIFRTDVDNVLWWHHRPGFFVVIRWARVPA